MSKFLKGTLILLAAGLITRVLGFINRIVLARFIGAEGVGLYNMAFPTLILVITITQFGLPVAISKSVSEAIALHNHQKVRRILVVSLSITLFLSILFTPALIYFTPYLSEYFFTDSRVKWPLLVIAPVVPIIAISSVLRGYFQGKQEMKPAAISQLIEQVVRISLIVLFTKIALPYGIEFAAAGAMLAAVFGELASLIYISFYFKLHQVFRIRKQFFIQLQNSSDIAKELLTVAIPTLGSRMIGSISWFFEPIVVSYALMLSGLKTYEATSEYGTLTGFALPLLMLPSFITLSLSTALVPAISEAYSLKNYKQINHRLNQSMRLTFITGGLAISLLFILAQPLMTFMYGTSDGTFFVQLMAPLFLFAYCQGPLQSVLQALNLARSAMVNSLIGAICKLSIIFGLASQPAFGINGVAIGLITSTVLVTFLHYFSILKVMEFKLEFFTYIKNILLIIFVSLVGYKTLDYLANYSDIGKILIVSIIMSLLYLIGILLLRLMKKEELQKIPFIKKFN